MIAVLTVFLGKSGSDGEDSGSSGEKQESSSSDTPDSSSHTPETPETSVANFAKLPEACKTISEGALDQLVPGVKVKNGTADTSNTADNSRCYWSGSDDTNSFRFLSVTLWRYDSDTRSGDQHAEDTYDKVIADARTRTDAWNIETEPAPDIGDQATAISFDSKTNKEDSKEATLVARTGNVVVRVYDSGSSLLDNGSPPTSASIVRDATTAAKIVVTSVADANR
ncbi:hypothetical protein A8W25_00535 [Streptomyces sp. ERV7]|uniref:hypothetical protein n=1 Tax=Streptomyces sp. ERV7 TaxID=1322334 RepID=UPI0007F39AFF|nr:hypothetical protein [Streptomyces sp. ERV7]OAR26830.1 hypothetical protein A8W25_00535 [Streptomyces sp. ERV7]